MPLLKETGANERTLRVVAIGGGTGLSTLLRGLKRYVATPDRRKTPRLDRRADGPQGTPGPERRGSPELPHVSSEFACVIRLHTNTLVAREAASASGIPRTSRFVISDV